MFQIHFHFEGQPGIWSQPRIKFWLRYLLASCVTLGKLLDFSESVSSFVQWGRYNIPFQSVVYHSMDIQ